MNTSDTIKNLCGSVNPRPKESEKNMEEYEYMTANTREAWHTIVDAIFRVGCEIKCTLTKCTELCVFEFSTGWARADRVENGREYRWKKPSPPKVKKLVNREQEDFWPLIGRYWAKDSADRRYLILDDAWHSCAIQDCWQIAPLGTEDWQPMQKEIEVEG